MSREIVGFAAVAGQIKQEGALVQAREKGVFGGVAGYVFVVVGVAQGFHLQGADIEQLLVGRAGGLALEHRQHVQPVDLAVFRQGHAGQVEESGEEIDVHGCDVDRGAGWDDTRPGGDEGHGLTAIEAVGLAPAVRAGRAFEPGAVVAGEEDQRITLEAQLAQFGADLADRPVDFLNAVAIGAGGAAALEIRAGMHGEVREGRGVINQERLLSVFLDETEDLAGDGACQRGLVGGGLDHHLVVAVESIGQHVIGIVRTEEVVKTLLIGQVGGGIAQVPFAENAGAVAAAVQGLGESDLIGEDAPDAKGKSPAVGGAPGIVDGGEEDIAHEAARGIAPGEAAEA